MKAISLTQPWATLIAIGAKRIETRSWPTKHRGPIAIHAAKAFPVFAQWLADDLDFQPILAKAGYPDKASLPLGQIVAVANLVDCIRFVDCYERNRIVVVSYPNPLPKGQSILNLSHHELAFGDFTLGRYGFLLDNVIPINPPIPVHRGWQRIWNCYDPAAIAAAAGLPVLPSAPPR